MGFKPAGHATMVSRGCLQALLASFGVAITFAAAAQPTLDQYDRDSKSAERANAVLEQPRPTLDNRVGVAEYQQTLIRFYARRADAARRLGDTRLQIAELRKAHEIASGGDPQVVSSLASAEHLMGNRDTATRLREEILQKNIAPGWRFYHISTLANYYSQLADFSKATAALASAERLLNEIPPDWSRPTAHAQFHWARATVLQAQGRFKNAEAAIRIALDEHRMVEQGPARFYTDQQRYGRGLIETQYAAALRSQGKLAEAEWIVREALERTVRETTRSSVPTARIALALAGLMQAQGRYGDTLSLAQSALKIVQARGGSDAGYNTGNARLLIAQTEVLLGQYEAASAHFADRLRVLQSDSNNREAQGGGGSVYWGYAFIRLGRPRAAVDMLRAHLQFLRGRSADNSYAVLETRGFVGCALFQNGEVEEAAAEFEAVVPALLNRRNILSRQAQADVTRESRLNWILEGYMELLARHPQAEMLQPRRRRIAVRQRRG
jgi:tetratricopeptide (TPR) repeat protein